LSRLRSHAVEERIGARGILRSQPAINPERIEQIAACHDYFVIPPIAAMTPSSA
jgi:hypothetical protein